MVVLVVVVVVNDGLDDDDSDDDSDADENDDALMVWWWRWWWWWVGRAVHLREWEATVVVMSLRNMTFVVFLWCFFCVEKSFFALSHRRIGELKREYKAKNLIYFVDSWTVPSNWIPHRHSLDWCWVVLVFES